MRYALRQHRGDLSNVMVIRLICVIGLFCNILGSNLSRNFFLQQFLQVQMCFCKSIFGSNAWFTAVMMGRKTILGECLRPLVVNLQNERVDIFWVFAILIQPRQLQQRTINRMIKVQGRGLVLFCCGSSAVARGRDERSVYFRSLL